MSSKKGSEYQDEFGLSKRGVFKSISSDYKPTTKSYDVQPVGGRKIDPMEMAKNIKRVKCSLCGKFCADANKWIQEAGLVECPQVTQLPVPAVHKLRYSTNNYVSAYDWY